MQKPLMIISYTEAGARLGQALAEKLDGVSCRVYVPEKFASDGREALAGDTKAWIREKWGNCDFLFICAAGIAIRMIAPCVDDKFKDSAVLVMDEAGRYVIPILSGHVGGGVPLAQRIHDCIGAEAVITTGTDVRGAFSPDVFAVRNGLTVTDREKAKRISAAVLAGEKIAVWVDPMLPREVELLEKEKRGTVRCEREELSSYPYGIVISESKKEWKMIDKKENGCYLWLAPRNLVIGIGCKKGVPAEVIREGVSACLAECDRVQEQIAAVVSIDRKAQELGILECCEAWDVPFLTYTANELAQTGEVRASSAFVEQVTGVDNVCERAVRRYLASGRAGTVIQEKKCLRGMTVAIGCVKE